MTGLEVYLICILDSILLIFELLFFAICILYIFLFFDEDFNKNLKNRNSIFFLFIISILISIFLPTTKQAALIYIIPKVTQNKFVEKIPAQIQNLVDNIVKEQGNN